MVVYLEQPIEVDASEDTKLSPECNVQGRLHAARWPGSAAAPCMKRCLARLSCLRLLSGESSRLPTPALRTYQSLRDPCPFSPSQVQASGLAQTISGCDQRSALIRAPFAVASSAPSLGAHPGRRMRCALVEQTLGEHVGH